jgi:hypothetical protein
MVWVREWTIPTERPLLVGEVIANFLRIEGARWSAWRIPTAVFSVSRQPLLFYQVAPQLYSRGWVDLFQTHYFFFSGSAGIEPGPPVITLIQFENTFIVHKTVPPINI